MMKVCTQKSLAGHCIKTSNIWTLYPDPTKPATNLHGLEVCAYDARL